MSSQNSYSPPPDDQAPPGKVSIDNAASNQGAQGIMRDVTIHHHHGPAAPPTPSALTARQRAELLDRLKLRYQELLDHALPHQVRLQLGLHTRPDAVDPAWRRMLLRGPRASSQPVPPDTPVLELFDGQQGQLLVLGAPGAGKTTLIVELAQALTARALADGQARIPVVLNVAAWRSGQSLRDWLAPTLRDLLGASKRFAAQLAASDDLLLLLDGLDEVAADHRAACVAAINAYLGDRDLAPPLVVGCRSREYADMGARLVIAGAVELEPLELPAIEQALAGVPAAQGVLAALQTDELLRELATTPLMVNVLLLAHGGQRFPLVQAQTLEERRVVLWRAYVRHMLVQRELAPWSALQVLGWLRWLACLLHAQNETNFLIDNLQPALLTSMRLRWWYRGLNGLVVGVVFGLVFGLPTDLPFGIITGSIVGLNAGLLSAPIKRREQQHWSWSAFWRGNRGLRLVFTLVFGLGFGLIYGLIYKWTMGVVGGLLVGIGVGLLEGWQISDLDLRDVPMQGLRASAKTGLLHGLIHGLALGAIGGSLYLLVFGPDYGLVPGPALGLVGGLILGLLGMLIIGPFFGLSFGLEALLQHYTLRFVLWRASLFPFRAVTFLNTMTDRLLLERDGAFYRFRHLLLRDFIADLSDEDIARLAREIDGEQVSR